MLPVQRGAPDRPRHGTQQGGQRVFLHPYLLLQSQHGGLDGEFACFGLGDCRFGGFSYLLLRLVGAEDFRPRLGGAAADVQLAVQHQQVVVAARNGGYQLRLHGLAVGEAAFEGGACPAFGVDQLAEQVYFPFGGSCQRVSLRGLCPVIAADAALWRERYGRQVGQARREQRGLGFLNPQACYSQVGVVLQPLADERLQHRVGEQFRPRQGGDRGGVFHNHILSVERIRLHLRTGIGFVYGAARQQCGGTA